MRKNKVICIILCVLVVTALTGCEKRDKNAENPVNTKEVKEYLSGKQYVELEVEGYGTIKLELDADLAPITVTHFVELTKDGFYDGLTFHRIIDGFMIQGGDGASNVNGEEKKCGTIKGEFRTNGIENDLLHERGVISMARIGQQNDSADSQFFIVHQDSPHLDGDYAAFGKVTEGMEIVDEICKNTPVLDQNGTVAQENQPVIQTIRMMEP